MTGMNPTVQRALYAIAAGLIICLPLPSGAADDAMRARPRVSIAESYPSGDRIPDDVGWPGIRLLIIADLAESDRMTLVEANTSSAEDVNAAPVFDKWRSLNTEWLVTGRVTPGANQRFKLEFRLWHVATGQQVLGQQYLFQLDEAQNIPHLVAAQIRKRLVGD
jgi:Tol biopolymer transport system component